MQMIKKLVPPAIRRQISIKRRFLSDYFNGTSARWAKNSGEKSGYIPVHSIRQKLVCTPASAAKPHNIGLAISKLNHINIEPGQVFSFWQLVGNPSAKNGYKKSRSIIGNQLQEETGGGLCQLSGLIYFLALHAGMTITERHNHSMDIYREEERFTPLGSDATVVYGYKDLRFMNPGPASILLQFELAPDSLTGKILSSSPITTRSIEFSYKQLEQATEVTTIALENGIAVQLDISRYRLPTFQ